MENPSNGTDSTTWKVHSYLLIVIRVMARAYTGAGPRALSLALSATYGVVAAVGALHSSDEVFARKLFDPVGQLELEQSGEDF
jgi:hypothetical protein